MPTMPYFTADGKRTGGTTYVIGQNCGWNKDALMAWANREGLAGRNIRQKGGSAERAADVGTAGHAMVEAHVLGQDPEAVAESLLTALSADEQKLARTGYGAFVNWMANQRLRIVATELYGVDEEYRTGYCLDALALEADGALSLLDWKFSGGTYADHVIQAAAYTTFEEKRLSTWLATPIRFRGAHVVRFDKRTGMFSHKMWPREALETAWRAFTWLRALHEVKWEIEALTR